MKLLIYEWRDYLHYDIYDICSHYNISYDTFTWEFNDKNHDEKFQHWFAKNISLKQYDALISVNYFPLLAEAAHKSNVKYIAWCYDNPLNVLSIEDTLGYSTNHVFMFDRIQCEAYQKKGFKTVYHMPLGVNARRLSKLSPTAAQHQKYDTEIAFVGNLYSSRILEILAPLDEYTQGFLKALMDVQSKLYGCYLFDEILTPEFIQDINKQYRRKQPGTSFRLSKEALSFAMASEVTRRDRLCLLNLLGRRHEVTFYSYEQSELIKNVHLAGPVDYVTEMPLAFHCAKINLNPTLRIIQSGIPLRAFDIMGAGGFLLSSWQPELAETYIDGEELVMYDSYEDAVAKAAFYLQHEDIRRQIAAAGQKNTFENHDLNQIFMKTMRQV